MTPAVDKLYRRFFQEHPDVDTMFNSIIGRGKAMTSGSSLVDDFFDPMIDWLYKNIEHNVAPETLSEEAAEIFIGELSVFARYNATLLLRAADNVRGFCPELAQELMRNFLEEGGERGKLPAHYVIFTGALIKDLNLRVNGWLPRVTSTHQLLTLIDLLAWSHCPSTVLGMYYAAEAVAISETLLLRRITNKLGELRGVGSDEELKNLDFYYKMHLDDLHFAATDGIAVEQGHQEGIAKFIREGENFGFLQPQIVDGFLQMLSPFVAQWLDVAEYVRR